MTSSTSSETSQSKGYTPKKGQPTPKRTESEKGLRRPLNAPQTRREAYRQYRERRAQESRRTAQRSGAKKGEEQHFRPQDLGPVRAYARDFVDSRRSISEFFLYFSLVVIVLLFVPAPAIQLGVTYVVWPAMMVGIVAEGIYVGNRIKREARTYFPGEDVRGAGFYAAMRQLQIRKLRLPKPRVRVGEAITPAKG
ncbi:hypothetical protein F4561_001624 [Lipingzhangella halophila]|uniref:DUF3043 family protein n=1 Tax=Lipingzhangella halophila TaxID=1783352 RepID=A0A7W7RF66_9ACTN|nr:DUF3043 domain-containing protein [Lipingzhangella halophila]MBB4930804.1 hypothetical protein [Lipingzhangella halophila]